MGQTERVNQILEDMLRACALAQGPKWEDCLPYAEFSYNNSFQTSLKMSPYEALYGRKCRTPLNWSQTGDFRIFHVRRVILKRSGLRSSLTRKWLVTGMASPTLLGKPLPVALVFWLLVARAGALLLRRYC